MRLQITDYSFIMSLSHEGTPLLPPIRWEYLYKTLRRITIYTYKNRRERKGKLYIWEMKTGRNVKVSHE